MRVRSFRERTAGERDGDGAATVTTPKRIVIPCINELNLFTSPVC